MRMSIALEMCGVAKRYTAGAGGCVASANVLRSIDLMVCAGDATAVVGPPGSGKSTLLLAAAGLLVPDAGEIRWFGDRSRAAAVRHALYYVAGAGQATPRALSTIRMHLIDDPDALGAASVARLAGWIARRCARNESVLVATRNRLTAQMLASRIVTLDGGRLHATVVPAPRVAERRRDSVVRSAGD
ncbi:MAG: ABC transporter ATP-binding protein [Gemmatimonadaceae bacterium]